MIACSGCGRDVSVGKCQGCRLNDVWRAIAFFAALAAAIALFIAGIASNE